jgi:ABC-2 type transport system ATP-binding protein
VAALAARAAGPDGEIPGLTVTRPSLEDTYLRLIGAAPPGPDTPEDTP